ncbi:hypothetical protein BH10PSE16_BH10PSE16_39090 [soil metagenome]
MALLAGVKNTRTASPKSSLRQQQVQLGQRVHRGLRGAQFHVSASHGIEHPGGNHYHDAWSNLKVDYLAVGTLLAVFAPDATSIQRMPAIEDFNFLPDMGRMTR